MGTLHPQAGSLVGTLHLDFFSPHVLHPDPEWDRNAKNPPLGGGFQWKSAESVGKDLFRRLRLSGTRGRATVNGG